MILFVIFLLFRG